MQIRYRKYASLRKEPRSIKTYASCQFNLIDIEIEHNYIVITRNNIICGIDLDNNVLALYGYVSPQVIMRYTINSGLIEYLLPYWSSIMNRICYKRCYEYNILGSSIY
jgi:hypothetical protein